MAQLAHLLVNNVHQQYALGLFLALYELQELAIHLRFEERLFYSNHYYIMT